MNNENGMTDDDSRMALRSRFRIGIFVLIALILLIGGYGYYHVEAERIRQEKYQDIAAIGELKAGQIQYWRQQRLADARRAARSPFFSASAERMAPITRRSGPERRLAAAVAA